MLSACGENLTEKINKQAAMLFLHQHNINIDQILVYHRVICVSYNISFEISFKMFSFLKYFLILETVSCKKLFDMHVCATGHRYNSSKHFCGIVCAAFS